MAIDRSKFKKSSASQMVQADKDLNKSLGRKEKGSQNGHELDEGSNLVRIYPVHPDIAEKDEKATFTQPFVQTFIPAIIEEKDKEGKLTGKKKDGVKPVFNAVIHGGVPKDLVDEFIKLSTKWAKEYLKSDEERKEYLEPVYGNYAKKVNGITYPAKWVVYADKYPNANSAAAPVFDKFFFKKSIKDRLNIIAQMESKNDPLGTDPFTDIEEGRAISIFVNPEGGAQNYYTTELDNTTTNEVLGNGRTVKVAKQYPLSDAQLEVFLAAKPLQELYGNCAKRKNFETQLAGLELFDKKHNMGIFGLPEWDAIVLELDGYYPEEGAAGSEEPAPEEPVADTDDNSDEFDLMNRQELQAYAKEHKTGILVKPSLSDDDIRTALRKWQENSTITHVPMPGDSDYIEAEVISTVVKEPETAEEKAAFLKDLQQPVEKAAVAEEKREEVADAGNKPSASDRLKMLRAKAAGKASVN